MSHTAVNWALEQKHLRPSEKLTLICLADRHNKDTGACFPSQAKLAEDACVSRSSLNDQLDVLEALGFFAREVVWDEKTKRQKATQYHLNIGHSVSEIQTREIRKAVSENRKKPCPKNGKSRVQNSDTNPVIRTSNNNHGGGGRAKELSDYHLKLLSVCKDLASVAGLVEADRWLELPGITANEVLASVSEQITAAGENPINSMAYFTPAITRLSALISQPQKVVSISAKKTSETVDPMARALARLQAEGRI